MNALGGDRAAGGGSPYPWHVRCCTFRSDGGTAWKAAGDSNLDLLNVLLAAKLVGAERVDKGQVTAAEYQLQLAELNARITEERRRRSLANADLQLRAAEVSAETQAAQAQSAAALVQGLAALQSANRR